ncbi:MAG: hypothetical protein GY927_19480 [bacterium]|nr:hypothetical protein [Gammaproteobacteria bacterium]MCP4936321.1 hypothetical protein [bacterium]
MKTDPVFQLPENLPPETVLALVDYFKEMADVVWKQYESELLDYLLEERNNSSSQVEIEFFDDIEF